MPADASEHSGGVWTLLAFGAIGAILLSALGGPNRKTLAEPAVGTAEGWEGRKAGEVKVVRIKDQELRLRWCPPGSFTMGSPPNEEGRFEDEAQVDVKLTRGFWMQEIEVTQGLWEAANGPQRVGRA